MLKWDYRIHPRVVKVLYAISRSKKIQFWDLVDEVIANPQLKKASPVEGQEGVFLIEIDEYKFVYQIIEGEPKYIRVVYFGLEDVHNEDSYN